MSFHVVPGMKSFERLPSGLACGTGSCIGNVKSSSFKQFYLFVYGQGYFGIFFHLLPFLKGMEKEEWNKVDYLRK